jgi:7-cyano-7-deazaguanine synthase
MITSFVLLSGGMDSAVALSMALKDSDNVLSISVDYGQRHKKEINNAKMIADHFNVDHLIMDLTTAMSVGGLTDKDLLIPKISYEEMTEGLSPTYVPYRNGILLSCLAGLVQSMLIKDDDGVIYYGAHLDDSEGGAYPDCSEQFFNHQRNAIYSGTAGKVEVIAPILTLSKKEVVQIGERNSVPWFLTWSCYEGREKHCGECPTCKARKAAFFDADVIDPTEYET